MWRTFTLFLLCLSYTVSANERWFSRAKDLVTANFTSAIPSATPAFIMFYNLNCEHCKEISENLDQVIAGYATTRSDLKFYRINGPGSPELINRFDQVKDYPTLTYFEPSSPDLTEVYSGGWSPKDIKTWIDASIAKAQAKGYTFTSPAVPFDPRMCEGYEKANKMCDSYEKVAKEISAMKQKINEMRSMMVDLTAPKEEESQALKPTEGGSSWLGGFMIFVAGILVGFFLCYAIFTKMNPRRSRTTV